MIQLKGIDQGKELSISVNPFEDLVRQLHISAYIVSCYQQAYIKNARRKLTTNLDTNNIRSQPLQILHSTTCNSCNVVKYFKDSFLFFRLSIEVLGSY
jgi:hypothetical protein